MKNAYSLQMESNCYADDIFICSSAFAMFDYCVDHGIFVDGLRNRIALVSIDDDGYADLIHELYRLDYSFDPFRCLVPVNYDGSDICIKEGVL